MAREAEPFLTYVPWRNGEWKGHLTKANVRNVIRANQGRALRVFATVQAGRTVALQEIPSADWDTYFAEEEDV